MARIEADIQVFLVLFFKFLLKFTKRAVGGLGAKFRRRLSEGRKRPDSSELGGQLSIERLWSRLGRSLREMTFDSFFRGLVSYLVASGEKNEDCEQKALIFSFRGRNGVKIHFWVER